MPAWAIWTVHCTTEGETMAPGCWHHSTDGDTRAEAEKYARADGWRVSRDKRGGNTCPPCLRLRGGR